MNVKKLSPNAIIPTKGSVEAAGYDLYSIESYALRPMERHAFSTGIAMSIPKGLYGRVAPRSGWAFKYGIDVLAGVIDTDYRGVIMVILINLGQDIVQINAGDKIAQLIMESHTKLQFNEVTELDPTIRNAGGFGSTGN